MRVYPFTIFPVMAASILPVYRPYHMIHMRLPENQNAEVVYRASPSPQLNFLTKDDIFWLMTLWLSLTFLTWPIMNKKE